MLSTLQRPHDGSTDSSTLDAASEARADAQPGAVDVTAQMPARIARTLRRHGGVAMRAGVGAAVLLGVTVGVDTLGDVDATAAPSATAAILDAAQTPAAQARGAAAGSAAPASPILALEDAKAQHDLVRQQAQDGARELARARAAQARHAAAKAHIIAVANARARAQAQRAAAAAADRRRQAAQQADEASRSAARDPRSAARAMLAARGWSGQFSCLDSLWQRESRWNSQASNPSSGAFGIPQALPGSKMAAAGADWRTNPITQIRWGLTYIASTYGTPCSAWAHSQATGWY